jgi:hypothetical protein
MYIGRSYINQIIIFSETLKMNNLQKQKPQQQLQPKNVPKSSGNIRTTQISDVIKTIILENERGGLWVNFPLMYLV